MANVYQPPESNLINENQDTGDYGSIDKAISGDYELSIGDVLKESWEKTSGAKWVVHLAFIYYMLVMIGVMVVLGIATSMFIGSATSEAGLVIMQVVTQVGMNLIMLPMGLGLVMIGIKRSVDAPISSSEVFAHFSKMIRLFATMVLMYLMIIIGLLLLVLPGIYLMIAYYMAMPLVVEKNMSPWQALEVSRKTITHRWFSVLFLLIILAIIMLVSMIPLGLGAIWTLPMMMIAYGILYRNMFGVESETVAQ